MKYDPAELEKVNQESWLSMWHELPTHATKQIGMEMATFGPIQATVVRNLPEARSLNRIQGVGELRTVQDGYLAAAINWMRKQEVEYQIEVPVAWSCLGSMRAINWLPKRKFESNGRLITYVRDTSPPGFSEDLHLKVYRLGGEANDCHGLCYVADEVFNLTIPERDLIFSLPAKEKWRCYAALVDGKNPMTSACGAMYIHNGIARFEVDATMASTRGQGLNRALLRRRLIDAAEADCHTVMAQLPACTLTGVEPLRRNLLQAGFVEAHPITCWKRPSYVRSGQDQISPYWLSS
jgi:hypothetical protein